MREMIRRLRRLILDKWGWMLFSILSIVAVFIFLNYDMVQRPSLRTDWSYLSEAIEKNEAGLCGKMKEEYRQSCLEQVILSRAINKKDHTICNLLEEEKKVITCRDSVYLSKAKEEGEVQYCNLLSNIELQNKCKEGI